MRSDFFPDREDEQLWWGKTLSAALSSDAGAYGVSVERAAAFAALVDQFAVAMKAIESPATRTTSANMAKSSCRRAMEVEARALSRAIQSHPGLTDLERAHLGLTIPRASISRLPAPADAPLLFVNTVQGCRLELFLKNTTEPSRRGRPTGTAGATVWYALGDGKGGSETRPTALGEQSRGVGPAWMQLGNTTRTRTWMHLPELPFNTSVWLSARWYNPRGEYGPASDTIQTWTNRAGPQFVRTNPLTQAA